MYDSMQEVNRLLNLEQLIPYHPMSNGLVEKFNGNVESSVCEVALQGLLLEVPKVARPNQGELTDPAVL